jgi:tetratricopeptide (TPR) repeat protein
MGAWRLQVPGRAPLPLDGGGAEYALLRHLAVRREQGASQDSLRAWLGRSPGQPIGIDSLNTVVSKARALLREAAGGGREAGELAKKLLPRVKTEPSPDGRGGEAIYRLHPGVWVDLHDAADPPRGANLLFSLSGPRGGDGDEFQGSVSLRKEIETALRDPAHLLTGADLDSHLQNFTPPIARLAQWIPQALDRLEPGRMLEIRAPADSGRMHLAEAIELGARIWCGRSTEQIRVPESAAASKAPWSAPSRHLCMLDLTRLPGDGQRKLLERKLETIAEAAKRGGPEALPALLVTSDELRPKKMDVLRRRWKNAEPIALDEPQPDEIEEAFLICTRELPAGLDRRKAEFAGLAADYKVEHEAEIGLRAACTAAAIAVGERAPVPAAAELPPPPSQDIDFDQLDPGERDLAFSLAWFGSRPFDLDDAREATGSRVLSERQVSTVATPIPGGGATTFELRPRLIAVESSPQVPARVCEYLIRLGAGSEAAIERWPERAVQLLGDGSIEIERRLELAPLLTEPCSDQGLAKELATCMERLCKEAGGLVDPQLALLEIERGRLLTHLGRLREANDALRPVAATRRRAGEWPARRARAHLRLAIVAVQEGDSTRAGRDAELARKISGGELEARVEAFYGWEALYSSRFEGAVKRFEAARRAHRDPSQFADATLGLAHAWLRLGYLARAEGLLAEIDPSGLRRHTWGHIVRVRAAIRYLRRKPGEAIDLLDKALLQASSGVSVASAPLLQTRAILHVATGDVNAAEEDLERSIALFEGGFGDLHVALTHYVHALILEAHAAGERGATAKRHREEARQAAEQSVGESAKSPWRRARTQTLLGRLELRSDHEALAASLRAAVAAHRELGACCPDILAETLSLAAEVAAIWRMPVERRDLQSLAASLLPAEDPADFVLDDLLVRVEEVIARVEAEAPPEARAPVTGIKALGQLGETIMRGWDALPGSRPQVSLRLVLPRSGEVLPEGVYDLKPPGELSLVPHSPADTAKLIEAGVERRFVGRNAGAVLIASTPRGEAGEEVSAERLYLFLGEWVAELKTAARELGTAVIEPIAVDREKLETLDGDRSRVAFALALVEMPDFS